MSVTSVTPDTNEFVATATREEFESLLLGRKVLSMLVLDFNPHLEDDWMGALRGLDRLGILSVSYTLLGDTGLSILAALPKSLRKSVKALIVNHTEITPDGLELLCDFPNLSQVQIVGNGIPDNHAKLKALRERSILCHNHNPDFGRARLLRELAFPNRSDNLPAAEAAAC